MTISNNRTKSLDQSHDSMDTSASMDKDHDIIDYEASANNSHLDANVSLRSNTDDMIVTDSSTITSMDDSMYSDDDIKANNRFTFKLIDNVLIGHQLSNEHVSNQLNIALSAMITDATEYKPLDEHPAISSLVLASLVESVSASVYEVPYNVNDSITLDVNHNGRFNYAINDAILNEVNKNIFIKRRSFINPSAEDSFKDIRISDIASMLAYEASNTFKAVSTFDESKIIITRIVNSLRSANHISRVASEDVDAFINTSLTIDKKKSSVRGAQYLNNLTIKGNKLDFLITEDRLLNFVNDQMSLNASDFNASFKLFAYESLKRALSSAKKIITSDVTGDVIDFDNYDQSQNQLTNAGFHELAINQLLVSAYNLIEASFTKFDGLPVNTYEDLISLFTIIRSEFSNMMTSVLDFVSNSFIIRSYIVEAIIHQRLLQLIEAVPSVSTLLSYHNLVDDLFSFFNSMDPADKVSVANSDIIKCFDNADNSSDVFNPIKNNIQPLADAVDALVKSITAEHSYLVVTDTVITNVSRGQFSCVIKDKGLLPTIYLSNAMISGRSLSPYDLSHCQDGVTDSTPKVPIDRDSTIIDGSDVLIKNAMSLLSQDVIDCVSDAVIDKLETIASSLSIGSAPVLFNNTSTDIRDAVISHLGTYYLCLGPHGLSRLYALDPARLQLDTLVIDIPKRAFTRDPFSAAFINAITLGNSTAEYKVNDNGYITTSKNIMPIIIDDVSDVRDYLDKFNVDFRYRLDGNRYSEVNYYSLNALPQRVINSVNKKFDMKISSNTDLSGKSLVRIGSQFRDTFNTFAFPRSLFRIDSELTDVYTSAVDFSDSSIRGKYISNPSLVTNGLVIYGVDKFDTNYNQSKLAYQYIVEALSFINSSTFVGLDISKIAKNCTIKLFNNIFDIKSLFDCSYVITKLINQVSYAMSGPRMINTRTFMRQYNSVIKTLREFDVNSRGPLAPVVRRIIVNHAVKALDLIFGDRMDQASLIYGFNNRGSIAGLTKYDDIFFTPENFVSYLINELKGTDDPNASQTLNEFITAIKTTSTFAVNSLSIRPDDGDNQDDNTYQSMGVYRLTQLINSIDYFNEISESSRGLTPSGFKVFVVHDNIK